MCRNFTWNLFWLVVHHLRGDTTLRKSEKPTFLVEWLAYDELPSTLRSKLYHRYNIGFCHFKYAESTMKNSVRDRKSRRLVGRFKVAESGTGHNFRVYFDYLRVLLCKQHNLQYVQPYLPEFFFLVLICLFSLFVEVFHKCYLSPKSNLAPSNWYNPS